MTSTMNIRISPSWDDLDQVRDRSESFLKAAQMPAHVVDALIMVTCELAENAIKYGHYERPEQKIDVALALAPEGITVEVRSPLGTEDAEHPEQLDRMIQWIRGFQDPFQAYLERLKLVSSQKIGHRESGLGLVRIAYEGHCILDFFVDEHDTVAVSAVYPF